MIQVTVIFLKQDMRRNVLIYSDLLEICMGTPYGPQHGGRTPTEASVTEFCYKSE